VTGTQLHSNTFKNLLLCTFLFLFIYWQYWGLNSGALQLSHAASSYTHFLFFKAGEFTEIAMCKVGE
jgi:hypothetical protein